MKVETFDYTVRDGWSVKEFPDMDSAQTLILVFTSLEKEDLENPIKEIAQYYKNSHIIGCSTAGVITDDLLLDNAMSVTVTQFKNTTIKVAKNVFKEDGVNLNSAEEFVNKLNSNDLKNILTFISRGEMNVTPLIDGINSLNNKNVIITGGVAGYHSFGPPPWVIFNDEIIFGAIVGVGFYGEDICIGYASNSGWYVFGPKRLITRSEGNIIYEFDNKPALPLYKEYLGEYAEGLPRSGLTFPISIWEHEESIEQRLIRTIIRINEEEQSVTFAGSAPLGYWAQLMHANSEQLIDSAAAAANDSTKNSNNDNQKPVLAIAISCFGRRQVLGQYTEEELTSSFNALPSGSKQVGFYSYGELSPRVLGTCDLHNQTMTMTTFYEKSDDL